MNPIIRAQVKEFSEQYGIERETLSDQFEAYSIFAMLSGELGESVNPFECHLKGTEFGLDGVSILIQGEPVFDAESAKDALEDLKNPIIDFIFFPVEKRN